MSSETSAGTLNVAELADICELVSRRTGVVLGEDKAYMVTCRLEVFARTQALGSIRDVYERVVKRHDPQVTTGVVDCLLTKETSFYRNPQVFEILKRKVVPELRKKLTMPRLRIWSAACSTGQEPYTIAMCLDETGVLGEGLEVDILATDISEVALAQARAGQYSQIEVSRGLPVTHMLKHFKQEGHSWCISPDLRRRVRFQKLNLLESERPVGQFDIIFCRNVGIYFSEQGKSRMIKRILSSMSRNGVLFLGTSESGFRYSDQLESEQIENVIYYRRKTA